MPARRRGESLHDADLAAIALRYVVWISPSTRGGASRERDRMIGRHVATCVTTVRAGGRRSTPRRAKEGRQFNCVHSLRCIHPGPLLGVADPCADRAPTPPHPISLFGPRVFQRKGRRVDGCAPREISAADDRSGTNTQTTRARVSECLRPTACVLWARRNQQRRARQYRTRQADGPRRAHCTGQQRTCGVRWRSLKKMSRRENLNDEAPQQVSHRSPNKRPCMSCAVIGVRFVS